MSDDIGTLKTACFELARSTKWARRPIDTANIQRLADRLYEIAKVKVETSSPLGVDIPMVTRAVNYLHQKTTILDDPAQSLRARARRRPCVSSHVDVPGSRHLGSIEYTASLGWRAPRSTRGRRRQPRTGAIPLSPVVLGSDAVTLGPAATNGDFLCSVKAVTALGGGQSVCGIAALLVYGAWTRPHSSPPPSGDDSTRFCSTRCREAYDAGFPAWDENAEMNGHRLTPPLTGLRVVVGPPDVEIGSNPYQSVIAASERKRRKIEKRKKRENRAAKSKASKCASCESTNGLSSV
jgi:hypothetical protein